MLSICHTGYGRESVLFPLKISENGHYFVDSKGKPFLYNADTGWQIFYKLTTEEARKYMMVRKEQGFNTLQTQLTMHVGHPNRYGDRPFSADNDFSKPDRQYHDHVLKIIKLADSLNMLVAMSQPWVGCCNEAYGGRPEKPIKMNGPEKNRLYGEYLGKQFAECKNLFWIIGGDSDPNNDRPEIVAFAEGLRSTAPSHQLLTYHAAATHSSTDIFPNADWLGFSMVYTYWRHKTSMEVYEACLNEYGKDVAMPFVLGESQYEGNGKLFPNDTGTPYQIRRQAYWTMLCGGAGHAYGADLWSFDRGWEEKMKYTGAGQLIHFYNFFTSFPWYRLEPDTTKDFLLEGNANYSEAGYVTAAITFDRKYACLYFPEKRTVTLYLSKLKGKTIEAGWYNPRSGEYEKEVKYNSARQSFTPPADEDWVLILRAK